MALFRKKTNYAGDLTLVVGLGNPGEEYARSRHNAGFMVARELIDRLSLGRTRRRYEGRWVEAEALGRGVAVLLPLTFMNLSGRSVAEAARKKHISPDRIIVIHDDLDFPFGVIRTRRGGGSGGHNGLESVIAKLGTEDFNRVRIGIGRPDPGNDPKEWVLSPFDQTDEELTPVVDTAVDCVKTIISEGIEAAMSRFNRRERDTLPPA